MKSLEHLLEQHFIKYSLIPILVIEVSLLILYFGISSYISQKSQSLLESETLKNAEKLLQCEANSIDAVLEKISDFALLLQENNQEIFAHPKKYVASNDLQFSVAPNGVFYKVTKEGASLYYSSKTPITQKEQTKAFLTEAMDPLLEDLVNLNPNIVAAYFNSYDNMNRIYPFIDKVYEQYGSHIEMEKYNFYYLADAQHNPKRTVAWTSAYLDPAGKGWMISAVVPIYKGDFLEGVSGIDFTIDNLVKNVLNKELPFDGKMFLIDQEGMILAMPTSIEKLLELDDLKTDDYNAKVMETIRKPEEFNIYKSKSSYAPLFSTMLEKRTSIAEIELQGESFFVLRNHVAQTDWQLFTLIKKEKVFESAQTLKELTNIIGYAAIGFMVLFYLVFFYYLHKKSQAITRTIAQPLNELAEQTAQINTLTTIEPISTDIQELYHLSQNFIKMDNELRISTQKIIEAKMLERQKEEEAKLYLDKSMKDPLTGLYNRTKIDQLLPILLKEFNDENQIFSIIYLDLDHFKSINDTYGHQKGDEVLQMFATLLHEHTRSSDAVARMGGEEFMIIIQDNLEHALTVAEHLRHTVESSDFPIPEQVTSSFGVTQANLSDSVKSVVDRADQALYQAKKNGRNRVEQHG